ncbi:MAG: flavin reductase (DIM6/NTAB) family NADH-FMN oxidoreductase RutF [Pseudorhodobacter sp.]|jgi:flavin reductase (DIM6/NTAB) family NADH-FMN oxidoreductase RutF
MTAFKPKQDMIMSAVEKIEQAGVDLRELRNVLGCFATGVAVVTTVGDGGKPVGMTINSFSSVSLDPPLILWSISLKAPSYNAFATHPAFAVNIMGEECKDLSLNFARPSEDKFKDVDWRPGEYDVPVLKSALATLECEMDSKIASGDHEIFIGRVIRIDQTEGAPLIFHRGGFASLGSEV